MPRAKGMTVQEIEQLIEQKMPEIIGDDVSLIIFEEVIK